MTRKTIVTSLAAIIFATSIPAAAMAQHGFYGRYHDCPRAVSCQNMPQLTDAQLDKLDKLHQEHYTAIAPLRDSLVEKRMTLNALSRNPNTTPAELRQLTADISKLRAQIRTVNEDFAAKLEKEGLPCPGFRAYDGGRGMRHHAGHGMGYHDGRGMGYYGCNR